MTICCASSPPAWRLTSASCRHMCCRSRLCARSIPASCCARRSTPHDCLYCELLTVPPLPACGQPLEQRSRPPSMTVRRHQLTHSLNNLREPCFLGPEHRAAFVRRESIPVDVHNIDIARPNRNAFLHNPRTLIHERSEQPIQYLLVG